MVATSGSGWRLAPCLVELVEETDRLYPSRSIASDGSIGDPAHRDRVSDHNPSGGWVHAVDITDDKMHGCDADRLADWLISNRDPRIKYVIRNGQIAASYGTHAWQWRTYTGPSSHSTHTHISVKNSPAARNDLTAWWPAAPTPEDDDMPKATYVRRKDQAKVYLAGLAITPRHVTSFDAAEWHAAREGITITDANVPDPAAAESITDGNGTTRRVLVVHDGTLFGI